jgi:hypothetical protein
MYKLRLERSRVCEGFKLPLEVLLIGIASLVAEKQTGGSIGGAVAGIGPGGRASGTGVGVCVGEQDFFSLVKIKIVVNARLHT